MQGDQLDLFEYREDNLKGVFGSLSGSGQGSFYNPVTGIGSSRDPSQYFQITSPYILSHDERIGLIEGSRICQNIVQIYPFEASWGNVTFTGNRYSKLGGSWVKTQSDSFKLGSLYYCFIEASIEARLHGESFLLLGVDDGQPFNQELNLDSINTFNWAKTFVYNQVEKHPNNSDLYLVNIGSESQQNHDVILTGRSDKKIEVHKSRILKFIGDYLPPSVLQKRKKHQSSLQCAFDGFSLAMQSILNANAMLNDHSLFWYKLDGLASLVKAKKFDEIYNRFLTLQMSKSVLKGMAMDAKSEDVGFINRSYSGVKDILETMMDFMVAETGMVRFKILGTANRQGLGAEGRGLQDRLEHSLKIKSWQSFSWKDHLLYCSKLLLLSQNSITKGKLPWDLSVSFPVVLDLTPKEIAELHDSNQTWVAKAIDSGILNPLEARLSVFGNADSILNPVITLDPRFTELLDSDLEAQTDPIIESIPDPEIENVSEEELTGEDPILESLINPSEIDNGLFDHADSDYYLVFYEGRNTSQVVTANSRDEAISKAKKKGSTGSTGKVIEARKATSEETAKIRKGQWIRTRAKKYGGSDKPKKSDPFKFRPQLKAKVKSDQESLTNWVKSNLDSLETLLEIDLESRLDLIEFNPKLNKWVLYDSSKSRVIGKFRTEQDAKRREKQINFFKQLKSNPDLQQKIDQIRSDDEPLTVEAKVNKESLKDIQTTLISMSDLNDSKMQSILGAL